MDAGYLPGMGVAAAAASDPTLPPLAWWPDYGGLLLGIAVITLFLVTTGLVIDQLRAWRRRQAR